MRGLVLLPRRCVERDAVYVSVRMALACFGEGGFNEVIVPTDVGAGRSSAAHPC